MNEFVPTEEEAKRALEDAPFSFWDTPVPGGGTRPVSIVVRANTDVSHREANVAVNLKRNCRRFLHRPDLQILRDRPIAIVGGGPSVKLHLDKIRGFRLDADQYVTKPFGILELLERIGALLRRSARDADEGATERVTFGDVVVDVGSRTVTRAGAPVSLTPKAYELLLALVRRDGVVAHRVELLKEVWGYGSFIMTRTVDSHIAELRRKVDDPSAPRHILTVWKVGYKFHP